VSRFCLHVLLFAALLQTSCSSPTSPSVQLNFREGRHYVQFLGSAISPDPTVNLCVPLGVPRQGTFVMTEIDLTREGNDWVGRSPAGLGSLELRIWSDGTSTPLGTHVVGSIAGWADDRSIEGPVRDVRVTFQRNVALEGILSRSVSFVEGDATGSITFSDSTAAAATCPQVDWTMQPTSGLFPPGILRGLAWAQ
jgi:hypothetical protein